MSGSGKQRKDGEPLHDYQEPHRPGAITQLWAIPTGPLTGREGPRAVGGEAGGWFLGGGRADLVPAPGELPGRAGPRTPLPRRDPGVFGTVRGRVNICPRLPPCAKAVSTRQKAGPDRHLG
ncbi:hypothetical protein GCM10010398_07590 [Streptomyces fimbriatus]